MLVLTRRVGDAILIGENIEIEVLENHGSEVKLGISAPREVVILRKEICDAVRLENRQAASRLRIDGEVKALLEQLMNKLNRDGGGSGS